MHISITWSVNSLRLSEAHTSLSQAIISSDNGLSPGRRQAIIWTNAIILLILTLSNKFQLNVNQNLDVFIQENTF